MSAGEVSALARLEVSRETFTTELQRMAKVLGRKTTGDAVLKYRDSQLSMMMGGAEFTVPALGRWPGEARASAAWIRALGKVPPTKDPVILQVSQGRLRIAGSSIPCQWQPAGSATLQAPLGLDLAGWLRLAAAHDEEALERSGLANGIAEARRELEKRIATAEKALAPLGISASDLRVLVLGKLAPS